MAAAMFPGRRRVCLVAAFAAAGIGTAIAVLIMRRRLSRRRRSCLSSGEQVAAHSGRSSCESSADSDSDSGTPTTKADPPSSGPRRLPHSCVAGKERAPRDQLLDDGLRALGMLSGPTDLSAAEKAAEAAAIRARSSEAARHHAVQTSTEIEGEEADDTIVVERVSPEEEERRYFANLGGGDMFGFDGLGSSTATRLDGDSEVTAAPLVRREIYYT
eukprot:TRINITY_DN20038_c0_g1_i1.p1 TRINITY_DN20038_c0_g1~~TRINITY_DN20038_c0_g1_i1.p1  ORF type:complete len:240 (-),score=46.53 TRINITY_DN20038_c0_g1_i1:108-755(-)